MAAWAQEGLEATDLMPRITVVIYELEEMLYINYVIKDYSTKMWNELRLLKI